jgi:alpha-methylacyl-CoA racemase
MLSTLSAVRVLDLSRLLPGPFCSLILADLGAEVIRVESHLVGDPMRLTEPKVGGESCYFMSLNRNKKSLAVNLKRDEGRQVFLRLAHTADVIIEGFRPGQAQSLGIGYDQVNTVNPGIVYCSLSGYGQEGPFRDRPGHDLNYVALAGLLDLLGSAGGNVSVPPVQLADLAGALFAAVGILAALVARGQTGQGGFVDTSLFHSALSLLSFSASTQMLPQVPKEKGSRYLLGAYPCYHLYATKDGRHMSLAALEPVFWADFCRSVGREDLIPRQFPAGGECAEVITPWPSGPSSSTGTR